MSGEQNDTPDTLETKAQELIAQFMHLDNMRQTIFNNFKAYHLTGDKSQLQMAIAMTQVLDRLLKQPNLPNTKTRPLGLYHSAGSGFNVMPHEVIEAVARRLPSTELYGYLTLAPETAIFSAETFWFLHEQRQAIRQRALDQQGTRTPALDVLVGQAYIPIPNIIDGMPVIGPLQLSDQASSLFLSWIKGPTLHEQMPDLNRLAKEKGQEGQAFSHYKDMRLWAVSQMTGVWQASPPPLAEGTKADNLEQLMRQHYANMLIGSLLGSAKLLSGIEVTPDHVEKLSSAVTYIIERLPIDSGNIGRYFDAALRNFIDEVGNVSGNYLDAYTSTVRGGQINYAQLWDLTRRIDFSHVARRPFCVFEEDTSHITENWHGNTSDDERRRYNASTTLTRQGLVAYSAGRIGEAAEFAEALESLRRNEVDPKDVKAWRSYYDTYEPTIRLMPWIRKCRQGYLALVYASKARANQELSGEDMSLVIKGLLDEAAVYSFRTLRELPEVSSIAGIKNGSVEDEGMQILNHVLASVNNRAGEGRINNEAMIAKGTEMLTTYV